MINCSAVDVTNSTASSPPRPVLSPQTLLRLYSVAYHLPLPLSLSISLSLSLSYFLAKYLEPLTIMKRNRPESHAHPFHTKGGREREGEGQREKRDGERKTNSESERESACKWRRNVGSGWVLINRVGGRGTFAIVFSHSIGICKFYGLMTVGIILQVCAVERWLYCQLLWWTCVCVVVWVFMCVHTDTDTDTDTDRHKDTQTPTHHPPSHTRTHIHN